MKMVPKILCSALLGLLLVAGTSLARADDKGDCSPIPKATGPITGAFRTSAPGQPPDANAPKVEKLALGDWVAVNVADGDMLLGEAKCRSKDIRAYLNGHPMKGLAVTSGGVPAQFYFKLVRTSDDREAWGDILGSPSFTDRPLYVTLGVEGEPPLSTTAGGGVPFKLTTMTWPPVLFAGACFVALLVGFYYLVGCSNILRDTSPPEDAVAVVGGRLDPSRAVTNRGTYSLARVQGAWWFFIVIGTYLLIGIVTGDFYSSISSTALILLGIGAGTVVGGAMIDASKDTQDSADERSKRTAELKIRIGLLDGVQDYCTLKARQLDAMLPALPGTMVLTAQEQTRLDNLAIVCGPDIPQWLRTNFGSTFAAVADFFQFQALAQADEAQAAALAPDGPRPAADPQLIKLRAIYSGQPVADLCQAKALAAAQVPLPQDLQARLHGLPGFLSMVPRKSDVALEKKTAISRYRKLTNQSEGWFVDILSDAGGVSFHRFQLFSWALILGGVFIFNTYYQMNMPVFDTTLMGLLGLSAGTYLGLKIPEPTIPPH